LIVLLGCGYVCSPNAVGWYSGGRVRVCQSFADNMYSQCHDDTIIADSTLGLTPPLFSFPSTTQCQITWQRFQNGQDMITQMGFIYATTGECFNSANISTVSLFVLFVSFFVTLFF